MCCRARIGKGDITSTSPGNKKAIIADGFCDPSEASRIGYRLSGSYFSPPSNKKAIIADGFCDPSEARTPDPLLKRQMLYLLS